MNCLRSVPAVCRLFSGAEWRVLSATFHKHVLYGIVVFLGWKWVYCSLAVALKRTVFPFVKQCIEDKMAAECSYDLTFRAHFLSRRKRSVCLFFVKQLSYRHLILLNSVTLKSNLIVSGIQWLVKCPFCRETACLSPFRWLVYLEILPFSPN